MFGMWKVFCGMVPLSHKTTSFTFFPSVKVWGLNALWISHQNQGSRIWVWVTPLFPVTMCYTSSALSSSHSVSNSNVIAVRTIKCQDNLEILIFPWQRWTPLPGSGSVWSELRFSCVQGILLVSVMAEEVKVAVEGRSSSRSSSRRNSSSRSSRTRLCVRDTCSYLLSHLILFVLDGLHRNCKHFGSSLDHSCICSVGSTDTMSKI